MLPPRDLPRVRSEIDESTLKLYRVSSHQFRRKRSWSASTPAHQQPAESARRASLVSPPSVRQAFPPFQKTSSLHGAFRWPILQIKVITPNCPFHRTGDIHMRLSGFQPMPLEQTKPDAIWRNRVIGIKPEEASGESTSFAIDAAKPEPASPVYFASTRGIQLLEAFLYVFSNTRWVAYSEVLRSAKENPNA